MKFFKKIYKQKSYKTQNTVTAILIILALATMIVPAILSGCSLTDGIGTLNLDASSAGSNAGSAPDNSQEGESSENQGAETVEDINKKTLVIGMDTTYPPFEYVENGEVMGFDLDLIEEIASRMDKQIEIMPIEWDQDFKALREGGVDVIISAVPYNIDKEDLVDFSETYFNMKYLLITLAGSDIKTKEDLYGKKAGLLEATNCCIDEEYLNKFDIVRYNNVIDMIDALKNKEIAAVILNLPIAANLLHDNSDIYVILDEIESSKNFAIVFNEGSQLKKEFDSIISGMIKDGTLQQIYEKWFGSL